MSNPIETIPNAANAAASTSTLEESNACVRNLLENTRAMFSPDRVRSPASGSATPSRRGRKKLNFFKKKVFLMKLAQCDFLPGVSEQTFLKRRCLGQAKELCEINRSWTMGKIKQKLIASYPPHIANLLNMSDFCVAKCDKQKKLYLLQNINNGAELEHQVGNGSIILIPNTSFPNDLPLSTELRAEKLKSDSEHNSDSDSDFVSTSFTSRNRDRRVQAQSLNLESSNPNAEQIGLRQQESPQPQCSQHLLPRNLARQSEVILPDITNLIEDDNENGHLLGNLEAIENNSDSELLSELEMPTLEPDAPIKFVDVRREDVVDEMFNIYKDETVLLQSLSVKFIGEHGIDAGGPTNELFTIFWQHLFSRSLYFKGNDVVVAYLPIHKIKKNKENFIILGRILSHMIVLTGSLPIKLARYTYIMLAGKEEEMFNKSLLLQDFLFMLTVAERRLVSKALKSFSNLTSSEKSRLTALFTANNYNDLPNEEEIEEQVLCIAEKNIIRDPAEFINQMKKGLSTKLKMDFLKNISAENINKLWKRLQPTAEKVMECLVMETPYATNEEEKTFFFLQNYVGSLSSEQLSCFLLFVTASVHMPDKITVTFHQQSGLGRRPIAHTCGNVLEIASNYDNQQVFNLEFEDYLRSENAFEYSMI